MGSAGNSSSLHSSTGAEEEQHAYSQPSAEMTDISAFLTSSSSSMDVPLPPVPAPPFPSIPNWPALRRRPAGPTPQPPPLPVPSSSSSSRKRPRASRRAPTTVLTTDTSNFRRMVQEFTGIPSPPLSLQRRRLDLASASVFPQRNTFYPDAATADPVTALMRTASAAPLLSVQPLLQTPQQFAEAVTGLVPAPPPREEDQNVPYTTQAMLDSSWVRSLHH